MKIVNIFILLLAISQVAFNSAYSRESPRDGDYQITEAYDSQGRIINYAFDDLGRKTSTFFPDGSKETIEYMEDGGYATTKTDHNDQFVNRLEYDSQGSLVKAIDDQGIEAIYAPSEQSSAAGQAEIATQFDAVELPTIIVTAPYPYPSFLTFDDFVNQTYYISDSSSVVTTAGLGNILQWIQRAGKWVKKPPNPTKTIIVPQAFRAYTNGNFRHNLMVLTGRAPPNTVQAHHVLPVKLREFFDKYYGINIHEPRFGAWWNRVEHQHTALEYNNKWEAFLGVNRNPPPIKTQQEIFDFGRRMATEYGFNVHY